MKVSILKKMNQKFTIPVIFLVFLVMFLGIRADAAAPEKENPFVNLAKGKTTVQDDQQRDLRDSVKLTDEDKYELKYNKPDPTTGRKPNKTAPDPANGPMPWERYEESGAVVAQGAKYIQLDLGASYPIEVINLKRAIYDSNNRNQKLTYRNTAIVISENEDMSDGYLVYYNGDGSIQLPEGIQKPENTPNDAYQERMGGAWFYMDNTNQNGTGATRIGTTKTARYIRVYSDAPDSSGQLRVMELAVYGYKDPEDIQNYSKRRVINNENPLMIAAAYSSDTFHIGQEEEVGLQGYNTIPGRWEAVPQDLREHTVLMMHSNNLWGTSVPEHIAQAGLQAYYEACLKEGYSTDVKTMLMLVNASAVPGGSHWCITNAADPQWVDLMFRMYPNMEGVFSTENFWSGYAGQVANTLAKLLEIAHLHGGYMVYSEGDHSNYFDQVMGNRNFREAIKNYGDSYFMTYKNTQGSPDSLHSNSALMGSWLSGYIGGWGMLSDTWAWGNSGNRWTFEKNAIDKNWQSVCSEPEAIFGIQMLQNYLNGGVIYTFEFPEIVYGAVDQNSPAYTHVLEPVYRYICQNPAPTRAQVLNRNKVILYGDANGVTFKNTVGADNAMNMMKDGRYGGIPTIPSWGTREEVTSRLKETARREGASAPVVIDHNDPLVNYGAREYFNSIYPRTYLGDAFAEQYQGAWYVFNNMINDNEKQDATVALKAADGTARFTSELEPHALFIMDEQEDSSSIDVFLNNYRVEKKYWIWDNPEGWKWDGSSATGQGVSNAKRSVYRYAAYYNVANGSKGVPNLDTPDNPNDTIDQLPPRDNVLRQSVFHINNLSKAPTVTVVEGQAPDTQDGKPQYETPEVTYDPETKTATITLNSNGWVKFKISDLAFEVNDNPVKIEDPAVEDGPQYGDRTNLAAGKTVTASVQPSTGAGLARPLSMAVNGNRGSGDYTDPGGNEGGPVWIQVDLGGQHKIDEVKLWRYFADSRKYYNTVVLVSSTADFTPDTTLVLWNANNSNAGREGNAITEWNLPEGQEELYPETAQGKSFPLNAANVTWLDETKEDDIPESFLGRYVRIYMNGSNANGGNHPSSHIVEIEVMGQSNLNTNYGNVARHSAVSVSKATSSDRPASRVVDGNKSLDNYTDPGKDNVSSREGGPQWLQLDMGSNHDVEKLVLYRYWGDGRKYHNTVILLSQDKDFAPDETLVLWNANNAQSGHNGQTVQTWPGRGNGQTGNTHTLPNGTDPLYTETNTGREFPVNRQGVAWLNSEKSDPLPTERFKARYVRIYMNGSTAGNSNHLIEVEVFGERGKISLEDTEAPEQVTGLSASRIRATEATVHYLPSMDNMGLRHYRIEVRAEGEPDQRFETDRTVFRLENLRPDTEYRVTVTAVDNAENESDPSEVYSFRTRRQEDFEITADPAAGEYEAPVTVTLSNPLTEQGAQIYYTLDGTDPVTESGALSPQAVLYDAENKITLEHDAQVKTALRMEEDIFRGDDFAYTIREESVLAAPVIQPAGGEFEESQKITITCSEQDAQIFYTIDGTNPTVESTPYPAEGFTITETTTVKAVAVKTGMGQSPVAEAVFTKKSGSDELGGTAVITGKPAFGETLTVDTRGITGNTGALHYQWKRNDTPIDGANATTYLLVEADIGSSISCEVTGTAESGMILAGPTPAVQKADGPEAPTGLAGVAATAPELEDGKITGTTPRMEYAKEASFGKAADCPEGEISNLAASTYYVRFKETATHKPGAYAVVIVPAASGEGIVEAPVFAPNGGEFVNEVTVTLSSATEGAEIFYCLDDGTPNIPYPAEGISLTESATVKAVAKKQGMKDSQIVAVSFVKSSAPEELVTITFNPGKGTGTMAPEQVKKGETYSLPECSFTAPEGMVFSQWNLGKPGSEIVVNEDLVLYAQWASKPGSEQESETTPAPQPKPEPETETTPVPQPKPETTPAPKPNETQRPSASKPTGTSRPETTPKPEAAPKPATAPKFDLGVKVMKNALKVPVQINKQLPASLSEKAQKAAQSLLDNLEKLLGQNAVQVVAEGQLRNAVEKAAKDVEIDADQVKQAIEKLDPEQQQGNEVRVVAQPFVKFEIVAVGDGGDTENKSFTVNLTPEMRILATFAKTDKDIRMEGSQANAVQIGEPIHLDVAETVAVNIPLPTDFVSEGKQVFVEHKGYVYQGDVQKIDGKQVVSFENPHGFSDFTVHTVNPATVLVQDLGYIRMQTALSEIENGATIRLLKEVNENVTIDRELEFVLEGEKFTGNISLASGLELNTEGNRYTVAKKTAQVAPVPEIPEETQEKQNSGVLWIGLVLVVFVAVGGAALYQMIRKKQ